LQTKRVTTCAFKW